MKRSLFSCLLLAVWTATRAGDGPLTADQALASFQLEPGLRAELVAAEPLTASPCALAWDEHGRLFVAENRGYPTGGPQGKALGVIARLEDSDGDGKMDKRTVFADGLTFPNGLTPWRGGLIVTCAPDVLWLSDTNGDGRADVRRVLLTGFSTNGSTQLRVSHPTLGPDGWVWLACGLSGGILTSPAHPERPTLKTTTDVRFHPDTLEVESVDGRGQFGQSFDDYGRRFICMNRVQLQHVVWPARLRKSHSNFTFAETVQNCPELVPNPWLKGGGGAARLYPISANVTTADSHAGTFTAACGLHLYRGDALPGYRGRAFSCDPTGNLIHWDDLVPVGATFAARRSTNHVEFLASTDNWFRPVFLATGPDGALYVADLYRKTIEHPDYLPAEVRKRTDFESGREMGRIWRISPAPEPPPGVVLRLPPAPSPPKFNWKEPGNWHDVNLSTATSAELCRALTDANGWRRETAARLLLERRDPSVPALLEKEQSASALLLLEILNPAAIESRLSARLAADEASADGALMVLEHMATRPTNSIRLQEQVVKWIRWDNRLGFLAKLVTLGLPYERKRVELFVTTPAQPPLDPGQPPPAVSEDSWPIDRWQCAALLASLPGEAARLLQDMFLQPRFRAPPEFVQELGRVAAMEASLQEVQLLAVRFSELARQCAEMELANRRHFPSFSQAGTPPVGPRSEVEWELPPLHGMVEGLRSKGTLGETTLRTLLASNPPGNVEAIAQRSRHALTNAQPVRVRLAAASLLAELGDPTDGELILNSLRSETSPELQQAVARGFVRLTGTNAATRLLTAERWRAYSPAMRESVIAALFSANDSLTGVLHAIESKTIPAHAIDAGRRTALLKHKDERIRVRAAAVFKQPAPADRMNAFEQSKAALTLVGQATHGRDIFRQACANCHRLDREGTAVGPDLLDIRNQPKESILLHLVVPEYEIAPNFAGYTLETKDGRTLSGLITGETPSSVTLRQTLGVEETVLRANIASLEAMQLSLMPQELEKTMTTQELADLLAYLKGEE